MERSGVYVGYVHRDLRDPIFIDVPADGLAALEGSGLPDVIPVSVLKDLPGEASALTHLAPFLPYVECDCHGAAGRGGVEVVIDCNEEVPCTDVDCSAAGYGVIVFFRTEIRPACRICDFFWQCLIFTGPADSKVLPFRLEGSSLITVAGDPEFVVDPFRKTSCEFGTFFKCDSSHRDKWENVAGT